MNINELRKIIHNDVVTVVFRKKDGSTREMLCTTVPAIIGLTGEDYVETNPSDTIVTVWDLENDGWRSFKFDQLISLYTDDFEYVAGSTE